MPFPCRKGMKKAGIVKVAYLYGGITKHWIVIHVCFITAKRFKIVCSVCTLLCYMTWDNVKITMLQARLDTMSNKSSYYWKNHNLDLSKVLCQCYTRIHRFKYQTKNNKFQLTIDLAHTSAIVSVSGLGPCTPLSVTAKAKDLEIWNISTKSSPAVKHSH